MGRSSSYLAIFYCIFAYYLSLFCVSQAKDTLGVDESIAVYKGDYLESANQRFRITTNYSLAGWYVTIQYVSMGQSIDVWAHDNYLTPASLQPAYLTMNADGRLVVYDSSQHRLIVVNSQQPVMINSTTATILDNGNLVLRAPGGNTVWQSFDYPTYVWLQGMKLGIFQSSTRVLTSKPSFEQPASTLGVDSNNTKEITIVQYGSMYWRSGIWNGQNFSFLEFSDNFGLKFHYVSNPNETYFTWNSSTDPFVFFMFSESANITVSSGDFTNFQTLAVCDVIDYRTRKDQSVGCTNSCGAGDGFKEIMGDLDVWNELSYNDNALRFCKLKCRRNCSCYAYSNTAYDQNGVALGCKIASRSKGKLISSNKQRIFFRESFVLEKELGLPPTQLAPSQKMKSKTWKVKLSVGALVTFLGALALLYLFCKLQSRMRHHKGNFQQPERRDDESPIFEFTSIQIATNHFSDENKLGQGGFGPVYKGKLPTGQEIAVKRLNTMSWHGIEQFKTEITVITKVQHRNLVKLLGYCIHGEDRLLVYELLPNSSLDSFIFGEFNYLHTLAHMDTTKRAVLDWKRRSQIIEGIAQGLLYLHKYSRLRIIHRDLKASNVLLDNDLNPKISDFGTARIFGDDESRANTLKVVGTYGYMSPEYAMKGIISEKSDVYSFGVMMLEIITGKKNTSFSDMDDHLNLVGHVWNLWKDGRISDIADPSLGETIPMLEISRYVQVGLLCVEETAADRPTMSDVVSILNNESLVDLPVPNQPAFSAANRYRNNNNLVQNPESSDNTLTISDLEAR
nr:G-type lectin S-receptor-like serine/threonine-protein kinase At1g67520 [Coffea arabica]